MKAVSGFLLEVLDASAGGNDDYVLLADLRIASVFGIARLRCQPLTARCWRSWIVRSPERCPA